VSKAKEMDSQTLVNSKNYGGRGDIEAKDVEERRHSITLIYELYYTHIVRDKPLVSGKES
jgi:hypothetical protein